MAPWILMVSLLQAVDPLTPMPEDSIWQAVQWIAEMKTNRRGPYDGVLWYCKDGTVLPPKSFACRNHGGGIQYGVLGRPAQTLAERGIFVGTILAALKPEQLIADDYYRARALIVERYLERVLDGWVLTSAKSYRGFRQTEDEAAAARELLMVLMQNSALFQQRRYFAVRLVRSLPYGDSSGLADEIRALAGTIGDADLAFADLRFKIHAMPEPSDVAAVEAYAAKASPTLAEQARTLAAKIRRHYDPSMRRERLKDVRRWISDAATRSAIDTFLAADTKDALASMQAGLTLMGACERTLGPAQTPQQGERNLLALHVMSLVEELWIGMTAVLSREPLTRQQGLELALLLARGGRLLGTLSDREYKSAAESLGLMQSGVPAEYVSALQQVRRILDWGRARVLADVGLPLERYGAIEPRAYTLIDDLLRSGIMLPLALVLDRLTADAERLIGGANMLVGLPPDAAPGMRGENPGLATGMLRVFTPDGDPASLRRDEVVLLTFLPPDLPPVAGIISIGTSGSLSHVSLLARNLGIPYATVTGTTADLIKRWEGQEVMLGVSIGRRVALGLVAELSVRQQQLLAHRASTSEILLEIDADRLDLETHRILRLEDISPADSGVRVGPKAGELGRLKDLFAERVSDAAVIPFGAFVRHVDRPSANSEMSPLARLRKAYQDVGTMSPLQAGAMLLKELALFREAIATLPFPPGFEAEVDAALARLGRPGTFGVFVRSDTNVEDVKDFTGAGLNLTVPNRVLRDDILAAIRAVWASPYSERSIRWRQSLLATPEHVYPSVILHRTVPSEMSGVLVTTNLELGAPNAFTVSVSEGVAAVVDGGAPETLVLEPTGRIRLLASPRSFTRKVVPKPPGQGLVMQPATGRDPLLGPHELEEVRQLAAEVLKRMPDQGGVPWDIEFGLVAGKAHLMQIRPLKAARSPAAHPFLIDLESRVRMSTDLLDLLDKIP